MERRLFLTACLAWSGSVVTGRAQEPIASEALVAWQRQAADWLRASTLATPDQLTRDAVADYLVDQAESVQGGTAADRAAWGRRTATWLDVRRRLGSERLTALALELWLRGDHALASLAFEERALRADRNARELASFLLAGGGPLDEIDPATRALRTLSESEAGSPRGLFNPNEWSPAEAELLRRVEWTIAWSLLSSGSVEPSTAQFEHQWRWLHELHTPPLTAERPTSPRP